MGRPTNRVRAMSELQTELTTKQNREVRKAERALEKMAKPTVTDTQVDYDALTEKFNMESAESEANAEARDGSKIQTVFDSVEQMKYDVNYRRLADFIGIDPTNIGDYANELLVVMGWALENAKTKDLIGALHAVKGLKKSMGFQEIGPTSIKKLYRYIRLDLDSKSAEDRQTVKQIKAEKELLKE